MTEPKKYTAMTAEIEGAPAPREVTGYYVKHINATPPLMSDVKRKAYLQEHTVHYIIKDGFSDWGMTRPLDVHLIDPDTLREAE